MIENSGRVGKQSIFFDEHPGLSFYLSYIWSIH